LKLPSYLSLPKEGLQKNLATVLLVHGGPQSRDHGDFDAWTQFLTNRGYAVLQVNFRGSTGYGQKLSRSGLRKWGMEMQDDLSDAAQWLIKEGIADPKRIAIVGGSYGGYAALMGAAKTPDLFRAAVSFAGVTDLVELGLDREKESFAAQVGSVDTERQRLRDYSPVNLAANIKIPLLLVHGTQDRSVDFEQGASMHKALLKAGHQNVRFIVQKDGDHHLSIYEHRLQFFQELENFLAKNLASQ